MAARNSDRHRKVPLGDRAVPDIMAALALTNECTSCGAQQFAKFAIELQLAGWVRNLPDGSVEVFAEGERDALEHLRRLLKSGPPGAVVASVDAVGVAAREEAQRPFGILR